MGVFEALATAGQWVPIVVTVASVITAVTPTPKDDAALRAVVRVLRGLALNVGRARPADGLPPYAERRKGVRR